MTSSQAKWSGQREAQGKADLASRGRATNRIHHTTEKCNTRRKTSLPFPLTGNSHLKNMFRMCLGPVQAQLGSVVRDVGHGQIFRHWSSHQQQLATFCSLNTIPSLPGCSNSEDRQVRREGGTRTKDREHEGGGEASTRGHSQVLPAQLQTTANGILVYFRGPRTPTPGKACFCHQAGGIGLRELSP